MKKEVAICDVCKERLSSTGCDICNADLCMNCVSGLTKMIVGGKEFGVLRFCQDCKRRFNSLKRTKNNFPEEDERDLGFYDEDFREEIFGKIKKYIKGKIVAGAL